MGHLAEFLRETNLDRAIDRPTRDKIRNEWVQSLNDLMGQLKDWVEASVKESKVENLLTCRSCEAWIGEEGLGRYKVPGMTVELEGEEVSINPRGRNVLGFIRESPDGPELRAQGRVDVTNHRLTFSLLRSPTNDSHQWYIYNDLTGLSKPLTRDTFEAILVSLLK